MRELFGAGIIDSFGMALGWTVFVLLATARGGLAEAALYNVAMLAGVVLSAPVTGWLSRRFGGRTLLRGTGGIELVLRVAVLAGLIAGVPSALIAAGVLVMHAAAWTGFAAMRAEVTAMDVRPKAMTRYALRIAAVEAAGMCLAALLPNGPDGYPTGWILVAVFAAYAGSLVPTILTARRARVTPNGYRRGVRAAAIGHGAARPAIVYATRADTRAAVRAAVHRRRLPFSPRLLAAGGAVMLLASGPTLLAVPITTELYGRNWVAGAAIAFTLGCLVSTKAVELIGKLELPAVLRWSLWGMGMLVGWLAAPLHAVTVLLAQFLAGLSQSAFEGDMDSRVAEEAPPEGVTTALAYSASTRALGGSLAVRMLPMLVTAQAVGAAVSASVLILGVAALVIWAWTALPRLRRVPITD
jgi:MFS family permease